MLRFCHWGKELCPAQVARDGGSTSASAGEQNLLIPPAGLFKVKTLKIAAELRKGGNFKKNLAQCLGCNNNRSPGKVRWASRQSRGVRED